MSNTVTVHVGDQKITLVAPTSVMECAEVVELAANNRTRGFAAALGVCWPVRKKLKRPGKKGRQRKRMRKEKSEMLAAAGRIQRPPIDYSRYGGKISEFAKDFFDALHVEMNRIEADREMREELGAAMARALMLCTSMGVTQDDLDEAEDSFFDSGGEE